MELDLELIKETGKLSSHEFQLYYESATAEEDQREILIARCATDIELYSALFFPHYCSREFNEFHRYCFKSYKFNERNVRRADGAPRGCAKSTLKTLVKPLHDVSYGLEKFILIISNTTPLANKKLKDIRAEILANRALCDMFGLRFPKRVVGESEFTIIGDFGTTHYSAVGRGSEVRGIRIGESRPTKIVLDDVEHSDEIYNEKSREKTATWFFEDVTKAGDTGTNIELVGTVLHPDSLLKKLIHNPAYSGRLFKSIKSWSEREDLWEEWRKIWRNMDDPDRMEKANAFYLANEAELLRGTDVMWPEKESYLDLMKEMEEIGKRSFMKEKQNEPQGSDDAIFTTFHWYKEEPGGLRIESNNTLIPWSELDDAIASMDPATGQERQKGAGDFTVIPVGYWHRRTKRLFCHYDWTKRAAPTMFIRELFNINDRFELEKMAVETNLYRDLLLPNILEEKKRREKEASEKIHLSFYDVVQTENKMERIYRLEPKVTHGRILFNRGLSRDFMGMFENFPNGDHDDAPDALEILWNLADGRITSAPVNLSAMSGF
jgi:predicted phage terminase large subunit-like protein